jgi:hypothetical protein
MTRRSPSQPSGIAAKRTILSRHLVAALGAKRLDAITTDDVQKLKHRLRDRAPKTVNNVLTVLSVLLKKAVEWDAIERVHDPAGSGWMEANAFVTWVEHPVPWEIEATLIRELRPSLNLADNSAHPFRERLAQIRKHATTRARSMEIIALESDMPFKSQAQRRKFAQLLVEGKISNQTFEEWNRETGAKRLPERVRRSTKASTSASAKPRARKAIKRKAAKKR